MQCHSKRKKLEGHGIECGRHKLPGGGSEGMPPQEILNSRGSEMLFPAFSKSHL